MPIPEPTPAETQVDFMARCMHELQGEFPDKEQRLAVCYASWRGE